MSDRVVQSYHGGDAISRQTMHPDPSSWMAHWMRTSCKSAPIVHSHVHVQYENKEDEHDTKQKHCLSGLERAFKPPMSTKELPETSEARGVKILNATSQIRSLKKHKTVNSQFVSTLNLCQNGEACISLKVDPTAALVKSKSHFRSLLSSVDADADAEISSRGDFQLASILKDPEPPMKSHICNEKYKLYDFMGSTTKVVPYEFNSARAPMQSFMDRSEENTQSDSMKESKENLRNTNFPQSEHEDSNYQRSCAFSVCEKNADKHPKDSGNWGTSLFTRNDPASLLHDPLLSGGRLPVFHDVETMRICTTVDIDRQYILTKKTNLKFAEGDQMLGGSTVCPKYEGSELDEGFGLFQGFNFRSQKGVKLQSLENSIDDEAKGEGKDTKTYTVTLNNESSAETDIMVMDTHHEKNHHSGVASCLSEKDFMEGQTSESSQATVASSPKEKEEKLQNTALADDNNQPLHHLQAVQISLEEEKEPSTSKTRSLDVEVFLSHAEPPINLNSSPLLQSPLGPEPSSRWVKRLKPSTSGYFSYGTKSLKMAETSSHEKINKFFSKITTPISSKHHCKEEKTSDQTVKSLKNGAKDGDITLSHSWIQRWLSSGNMISQKKTDAVEVCDPQSSKMGLDEFQKRQFPSIAAMALMGKGMNSFRQCEIRKSGPFVVWNTKEF